MVQTPGDRHRQFRFVPDIGRGSQKVERPFIAAPPCKEHDARTLRDMVLVPAPGVTLRAGDRLAFPVNEFGADRIVPVTGSG